MHKKPYKPTEIVLRNVTCYAYAEMDDKTYGIWALGEAGYFEIEPAAQYRSIFNDMIQAVEILYFVTDIYNEPRKRGGGPSALLIYQEVSGCGFVDSRHTDATQYAEDSRFSCADVAEAERIFHRHREFLMMSFLKRTHNIGWSNTPLYQTLKRQFPVC